MARDFNELGAGMYECLGDTKSNFQTSRDLALVIDKVGPPYIDIILCVLSPN